MTSFGVTVGCVLTPVSKNEGYGDSDILDFGTLGIFKLCKGGGGYDLDMVHGYNMAIGVLALQHKLIFSKGMVVCLTWPGIKHHSADILQRNAF